MSLNAHAPTIVGTEWFPLRQRGLGVASGRQWACRFTPPSTYTGDDEQLYLASVAGSPHAQLDIVQETALVPGAVTVDTYRPNGDGTYANLIHAGGGTSTPWYVDVDEASIDVSDFIRSSVKTGAGPLTEYASAGFAVTKRPVYVKLWGYYARNFITDPKPVVSGVLSIAGMSYATPVVIEATDTPSLGITYVSATWWFNPATKGAWTAADIAAFDAGAYAGFQWTQDTVLDLSLYMQWMTVGSVTDDRVASGVVAAVNGINTISMLTPAAADTWTLTSGVPYLWIVSNPSGEGSFAVRALDSGEAHPDFSSAPVTFDANGLPASLGDTDTAAPMFVVTSSVGAALYGQPYAVIGEAEVYTGATVQQEVTLPDTASRGALSFACRQASIATTANLTAQLRKRSDSSAVGGAVTVHPWDVRGEPRLPQRVTFPAVSGAAGTAAQYYVEWSCIAAQGLGWLITYLGVDDTTTETLTANQQSIESGTTGWAALAGTTTIGQDPAFAYVGQNSLSIVSNSGTGTRGATTPTGVSGSAVVAGQAVSASGHVRSAVARTCRVKISFWSAGGLLQTTAAATVVSTTTGWTTVTVTGIAPVVGFVSMSVEVDALPTSETHYWDGMSMPKSAIGAGLTAGGTTDVATIGGVDWPIRDVPVFVGTTRVSPAGQAVVAA